MSGSILVLNAGSSSLKFAVHDASSRALPLQLNGRIAGIGTAPTFEARDADGGVLAQAEWPPLGIDSGHRRALNEFLKWLEHEHRGIDLVAVGHRIVHGGTRFAGPTVLDAQTLDYLDGLSPLAPLHQPHNLAPARELAASRPGLTQIGCFDTAFHRGHADVADYYALPRELHERGIRRYGFHGLSYEYIAQRLNDIDARTAAGRVVVAHLGNGASMCALRGGSSVDSTLGFSSLDGLPMGTRCGSLDPGVVLHLLREHGLWVGEVENLLTRESGLLGLSGISNDMRDLLASDAPPARATVDYFVYRITGELGRLSAVLGGLDALVFTAGIGEHADAIRSRVCEQAAWLGVSLDAAANRRADQRISAPASKVSVWVIPTNEEQMIAQHTYATVMADGGSENNESRAAG